MNEVSWPFGEYPPGGLQPLGPHVTAYYADGAPVSNSAIVRGTEATLVFDANTFRFARTLRAATDAAGPPLTHLVLSHVHDDHTFGAMHFAPPARVLATPYTRETLARWASRDVREVARNRAYVPEGCEDELSTLRIVVPDEVVERDLAVDLGAVLVHVRALPFAAHTNGDLWAYVEPDDVVICGDLWFTGSEPYLASGSVRGTVTAVERLRDAGAAMYLPGHGIAGTMGDGREDSVVRYCEWLLQETARGLERGLRGVELQAAVRTARAEGGDVRFGVEVPGFLEDNVALAERELRRM